MKNLVEQHKFWQIFSPIYRLYKISTEKPYNNRITEKERFRTFERILVVKRSKSNETDFGFQHDKTSNQTIDLSPNRESEMLNTAKGNYKDFIVRRRNLSNHSKRVEILLTLTAISCTNLRAT